ncbi:MAG: hypothetical protein U0805_00740 [Pirellulales bacterium]
MPANKSTPSTPRWAALPAIAIIAGLAFIAVSLVWPARSMSRANWSPEQALKFQAASVKLHDLSHGAAHQTAEDLAAHKRELQQAEAQFQIMRTQLDSAINSPHNYAFVLRILGGFLIVAGAISAFATRNSAKA